MYIKKYENRRYQKTQEKHNKKFNKSIFTQRTMKIYISEVKQSQIYDARLCTSNHEETSSTENELPN